MDTNEYVCIQIQIYLYSAKSLILCFCLWLICLGLFYIPSYSKADDTFYTLIWKHYVKEKVSIDGVGVLCWIIPLVCFAVICSLYCFSWLNSLPIISLIEYFHTFIFGFSWTINRWSWKGFGGKRSIMKCIQRSTLQVYLYIMVKTFPNWRSC